MGFKTDYSQRIHIIDPEGDGKAPQGLGVGDVVVTRGGAYQIMDVNPDGTYKSGLVSRDITSLNYTGEGTRHYVEGSEAGTFDSDSSNTGAAFSSYDPDIQSSIRQLAEAKKRSRIAGLESVMNSALSNLDTEQSAIKGTYYNQRNQAAADSDIGQYNFAQYMASRGMKGNAGAMPEIYRNAGLQNRLSALGQQEAQENVAIENQRTNLRNKYLSDVEAANAGVDAQALEMYINQLNQDRAYRLQERSLANQEFQTGRSNFMDTIGAYSNDYQAEINRIQNDGDPSNDWKIPILNDARNRKIAEMQAAQAAAEQQQFENALAMQRLYGSGGSGKPTEYAPSLSELRNGISYIEEKYKDAMGRVDYDKAAGELYDFINTYGGTYRDFLLGQTGLTSYTPPPVTGNTKGPYGFDPNAGTTGDLKPGYEAEMRKVLDMNKGGYTQDQIADYIKGQYLKGVITKEEGRVLAQIAGIQI